MKTNAQWLRAELEPEKNKRVIENYRARRHEEMREREKKRAKENVIEKRQK